jgi:hypothetical protein
MTASLAAQVDTVRSSAIIRHRLGQPINLVGLFDMPIYGPPTYALGGSMH